MKKILALILFISFNFGFSQNEANTWYFGENAGLDFNSGSPVALLDGELNTIEGCATISDENGNLLFYTNGVTVWDSTHQVMSNGSDLNGNESSTNAALVIPKPLSTNIYYIFTLDERGYSNGLQYSEVDMNLNSGLGDVTSNKNILLQTPVAEKITATKVRNEDAFWVVAHKWNSSEFITYKVDSNGVGVIPIISDTGSILSGFSTNAMGAMKISPDGSRLAMANLGLWEAQLFDFDDSTGIVSNPLTIIDFDTESIVYGVEFSPNNDLLYVSVRLKGIFQFDLTGNNTDILNSETQVGVLNIGNSALQLGPDGKIYVANNGAYYLDVIDSPNLLGTSCNYISDAVYLDGKKCNSGLPPFVQSFFIFGFEAENVCIGESTQFNANILQPYDSLEWDFGDTTTSTDENPIHTYASPGEYYVQLSITIGSDTSSDNRSVFVYDVPVAYQPNDINACDDNNDGVFSFDLTQRDVEILNGQDSSTFEVVYFSSQDDYNNDNQITNPSNYVNSSVYTQQELIASIRNVNNDDCEDAITFNINVFETPNPSSTINTLSTCDNTSYGTDSDGIVLFDLTTNESDILNGQSSSNFTVSYYTDAAFLNQIPDPAQYQNINLIETIFVQVANNDNSECVSETSFDINVYELPTTNATVVLSQCDDDVDGFSSFNLNEIVDEITPNSASESITFHECQLDAENGSDEIPNIASYINEVITSDTIWVRIENQNSCFRVSQVELVVSTTQIPNTFSRDFYRCDDGIDNYDGISSFDFSSVTSEIEALFPVNQQPIINYYKNLSDALAESDAILDISNYENIGYPNTQDIYVRVDSAINNDCLGLGSYITLHVDPRPIITGPIIIEQCDENNDGIESFDTTSVESELLQGQTETVTFSYADEDGNALPSPLPNEIISTQSVLNIFVTMTVTNSNNPNGGCSVETTISFIMDNSVIANPINDFIVCDDDSDGLFSFDTSNIEATIIGSQTDVIVTYFDSDGNSLPSPLPNPYITNTQTITARVDHISDSFCYSETIFSLIVSEQPIANTIQDDIICDDFTNDGEHVFNLTEYNSQILNGQLDLLFDVSYHNTEGDAQTNINALPNSYLVNNQSQTIFARIQNVNNTNCYDVTSFDLGVLYLPIASQPNNFIVCDDESNNGIEMFNLSSQNSEILNGQSETENTISFYLTQGDAENKINQISDQFTNTENPQTIYVRLENNLSQECYTTTNYDLVINELPIISIPDEMVICEGGSIELEVGLGYDEYLWSTNETTSSIVVDEAGIYDVTVTNNYGPESCSNTRSITVIESNPPEIIDIETTDWSHSDNNIIVYVEGNGNYEYSIDGVNYQDSNMFSGLIVDEYLVYVKDKNGCGLDSEEIYLLYYPKFFTPNGDDYHEYWHLYNSNREPGNKIFIYDRYGKLMKRLSPTDIGWDGTFNGKKLPSNDYWFRLVRQNGKQYTGHFSLKN